MTEKMLQYVSNCKHMSSSLVGSALMWVSQVHITAPALLLLLLGTCMASDHSIGETTGRAGAALSGSTDREWMCTDAAQWTEVHVGGLQ